MTNLQDVFVAWLEHAGCKRTKTLHGCIVLQSRDRMANWYIGSAGSVRYGRTRGDSHPSPRRFENVTGQNLERLRETRSLPGPKAPVGRL